MDFKKFRFTYVLFALLLHTSLNAQDIARVDLHFTDASAFPVNYIYYTTQDETGNYADALWEDNLEITENGVTQKLHTPEAGENVPASVLIILDSSGSMKKVMKAVLGAASELIGKLDENDRVRIIDFDSSVKVKNKFTGNKERLQEVLNTIKADGGTALYDAVKKGHALAADAKGLKAIVLLTDGKDENAAGTGPGSQTSLEELKSHLEPGNVPVYAIGLGKGVDTQTLDALAAISDGKSYYAEQVDAVGSIYNEIIDYLHSLHRLWYSTKNGKFNGTKREIEMHHKRLDKTMQIAYNAPKSNFWSHALFPGDGTLDRLGISPSGKRIAFYEYRSLLNPKGKRFYSEEWNEATSGNLTANFMLTAGLRAYGTLFRYSDEGLKEVNIKKMLDGAAGDFHADWAWHAKAISPNEQYLLLCARVSDQEYGYYFMLYDRKNKQALWEKGVYKGEFDEPGNDAVADNGTALVVQDDNLFALDKTGKLLFSKYWEKTDKRTSMLAISGDGSAYISRLRGRDRVEVYDMEGNMLWGVDSENNEKSGIVAVSPNGKYFGLNDQYGPRVYDASGKLLFSRKMDEPVYCSMDRGNGIAIANDGSFVYSLCNRAFYNRIE